MRTALIAGATGLVGGECLARLLADPDYGRVVAITRRPLPPHPKLESMLVDFEQLPSLATFPVDDLYCALGTTIAKAGSQMAFRRVDFEFARLFAKFGRRCGGQAVGLVSSVGADAVGSNFYLRVKGETEAAVVACGFGSASLFRPSLLLGARTEKRLGERLAAPALTLLGGLMIGGLRRYRAIDAAAVGAAMVIAVKRGVPGTAIYEFDDIRRLYR